MGQKVHPIGIRLGVVKRHNANWYANPKNYAEYLLKDLQVRDFLHKKLKSAMVSKILIERPTGAAKVIISTARPGIVIGKKGEDIEKLQRELTQIMGVPAQVSINEIDKPDLDARLVAESIASQLEKRVMFRRAMKRAVQNSMRAGAKGIKVEVSGRLAVQRLPVPNGIVKAVCHCIPCVQTLTTQPCVLKQPTVRLALKYGFSVVRSWAVCVRY